MGYIVKAKVKKFKNSYLFQRKCDRCGERYLFHISEAVSNKVFVCEQCEPMTPKNAQWTDSGYGIKITSWENVVALVYERQRRSRKNYARTLKEDDFICQYCYGDGDTIDHIIPISYGGDNSRKNLVCACMRCNLIATNLVFDSFLNKQKYIRNKIKND